jgi:hypothetical protein
MQPPSTAPFAAWVCEVFDRSVADPRRYGHIQSDILELSPADCVAFLTRLFEEPELVIGPYTDAQVNQGVNQGLWYLVDANCSNHMFSLFEPEVPWPERQRGIRAMATLFGRLFARRCSDHLSNRDEQGANPLNSVCYMWWDVIWFDMIPARETARGLAYAQVDAECLGVRKQVLTLNTLACWESALHGLGHWQQRIRKWLRTPSTISLREWNLFGRNFASTLSGLGKGV